MSQYIVLLGALVQLVGIYVYIKETIQGKTKPNRVTWLLWSVAPLIAAAAALADGVRWAALPVFMAGFGPLLVFAASFFGRGAYWKLEPFDYWCSAFSVLALALWALTREPLVAIGFAILSDGAAAMPTLIKSWNHPHTESIEVYTTGLFNSLTSLFALKEYNAVELSFPAYLILLNILLIASVRWGRARKFSTDTEEVSANP